MIDGIAWHLHNYIELNRFYIELRLHCEFYMECDKKLVSIPLRIQATNNLYTRKTVDYNIP